MQSVLQLHMQILNAICPDTLATLFTISVTEINFGVCEQQYLHFLESVQPKLVSCVVNRLLVDRLLKDLMYLRR